MDTTQNAGAGALPSGDAGQAIEQTQTIDTGTPPAEGQEAPAWSAPTEAEWKKIQKDQASTQRRFDKRTAEMHAALRRADELERRLAALETGASAKKDERPQIDQFQNFDEYNEAVARWAARQEGKPKEQAPQGAQDQHAPPPQEAQWLQQRESEVVQQAHQLAQHIPDFAESINAAADIVDALPWQIRKTLYESQHPALAAYVLEKQGAMTDLFGMTPQQAAVLVQQATQLGIQSIKSFTGGKAPGGQPQQQATAAPQPLAPNKGAAPGAKSEDQMSGKELLKRHKVY